MRRLSGFGGIIKHMTSAISDDQGPARDEDRKTGWDDEYEREQ
ncbi:hypothetical protein ABZ023_35065 [Streptomyces sp. NPDC006367]